MTLVVFQQKLKREWVIGTLLMDTTFAGNLNRSMIKIKVGSWGFNENMDALKHNILLRNYFKKNRKKLRNAIALKTILDSFKKIDIFKRFFYIAISSLF